MATRRLPAYRVADDLREAGHPDATRGPAWRPGHRVTQASPKTVRLWHDGPDEQERLDQYVGVLRALGYYTTLEQPSGLRPRIRITQP